MAEETEKIETEDIQESEQQETKEQKTEEKEETRESVVSKIGKMIKGHFSDEEKTQEESVSIPQQFYDVAQSLGWTDDEIMDFTLEDGKSLYTNEELLEMLPVLTGENSSEEEQISDKDTTPEPTKDKVDNSQDDEKIKKLLERIDALEKAQGERKEEDEQQELFNFVNRASKMFDEMSKEFEVFGVTEKLPKFPDGRVVPNSPQMKARQEVWDVGTKLFNSGVDFDTAMSIAIDAYKGKNLGKTIERNVIKDLKKREKKLSGKRVNHESTKMAESGPELIKKILEDRGKK